MIDLPAPQLAQIKQLIAQHLPGASAFAFGSRVTGKARQHSDLDVAVERDLPFTWQELATLREALMESDLPIRVDVVDWARCSVKFQTLAGRVRELLIEGEALTAT
jgi:predicted nucleotidyltransferase